uniref:RING-type domain-containing protein n=1 Tax=Angiostrongylus cantonensis TaxID=6313 RepID=A0A0K0D8Q3_ANGCA
MGRKFRLSKTDPTLMEGCNHSFCFVCTSEWLNRTAKCPICRGAVNSFVHNIHLPSHLLTLPDHFLLLGAEALKMINVQSSLALLCKPQHGWRVYPFFGARSYITWTIK